VSVACPQDVFVDMLVVDHWSLLSWLLSLLG
jgi:hypothetical protein